MYVTVLVQECPLNWATTKLFSNIVNKSDDNELMFQETCLAYMWHIFDFHVI